jgi:hypothetical protein
MPEIPIVAPDPNAQGACAASAGDNANLPCVLNVLQSSNRRPQHRVKELQRVTGHRGGAGNLALLQIAVNKRKLWRRASRAIGNLNLYLVDAEGTQCLWQLVTRPIYESTAVITFYTPNIAVSVLCQFTHRCPHWPVPLQVPLRWPSSWQSLALLLWPLSCV